MSEIDVDQLVDEIVTLPTLPQNVDYVTSLINDPDPSLAELGKAIATDPTFALKTLRLVNSAYYGLRQEVTSVELAVTLLGLKVVKNLVVTAIVCETLRDAEMLLRHSVACGLAMRVLMEGLGKRAPVDPDAAFSFGLLHDIGRVILDSFLPDEAAAAAERALMSGMPLFLAEREILGTDHAELGARLARRWKLPARLVATIAAHHHIETCTDPTDRHLAGLLAVADVTCSHTGFASSPASNTALTDEEWTASGLTKRELPLILDGFFQSLVSLDDLVGRPV